VIPRHLQLGVVVLLVAVTIAGIYVLRMRGHAKSQAEVPVKDNRPVAPPVAGPTEPVTIYVAYDDPGVLRAQGTRIPLPSGRQQRAQEVLSALVQIYLGNNSPHVLPSGAELRDVYIVDPGLAVIDVNAAFADGHRSGVLVEGLTVASMVETVSANLPGITQVKILVEGKDRETLAGHADLSSLFDTSSLSQMANQLRSTQ
jgi:Sporulation and spore germination